MKKALLLAFGKYREFKMNPAEVIVNSIDEHAISGISIRSYVIPVSFSFVMSKVPEIIKNEHPSIVIGLGLFPGAPDIKLEKIALNVKHSKTPDVDGNKPFHERLIDGPLAYESNLPLNDIIKILHTSKIPATISYHAGTFLCNALFYIIAHTIRTSHMNALYGFIHLPFLPEMVLEKSKPSLPFEMQKRAIALILQQCLKATHKQQPL